MKILENFSLKSYNTFHIDAKARYFVEVTSVEDIEKILKMPEFKTIEKLVLGEGSNILLMKDFDGLVIKMGLGWMGVIEEDYEAALVKAMAWENWHGFIEWCLENEFEWMENLSLIPGTVWACPIQNIWAYGVEASELIESVEWMDFEKWKIRNLSAAQCLFWYRDSIFKKELKGKWAVISVTFKLKKWDPESWELNLEYGAIKTELDARKIAHPTPTDVSKVVVSIRESKLPDPKLIWNAGSFFKNPVILTEKFSELEAMYPTIPGYPTNNPKKTKVAAGWLIEQAGWKGKTVWDAGVHDKQALVLVNYGSATGAEIVSLSREIQKSVFEKFGIEIEAEVNMI